MIRRLLSLGTLILTATLAVFFSVTVANAQGPLSESQREEIRTNCTTIKNDISQLQASDALLRVNRGQVYESIRSSLMETFNTRLSNNNLDTRGLSVVTNRYGAALDDFRTNYQTYERQLTAALRIDCTEDPDGFHFAVENARTERATLNRTVARLHQVMDDYRNAVGDFRTNFARVAGEDS